jgi:hypothetical protein
MKICKAGDIVVKTVAGGTSCPQSHKNAIFEVIAITDTYKYKQGKAPYTKNYRASKGTWRHATLIEKSFYFQGGRDITRLGETISLPVAASNFNFTNYQVDLGDIIDISHEMRKVRGDRFAKLTQGQPVEYSTGCLGAWRWYGVGSDGHKFKSDDKFGRKKDVKFSFNSIEEFEQFLNNNNKTTTKDEKTRIIESNGRHSAKGSSISSSRSRQIAVTSRPIGNKTSAKSQKTTINSSKVSANTISY